VQGTKIYKHRIFTTVEYLFSGTRVIKNYPGSKLPGYPWYPTAALTVRYGPRSIRVMAPQIWNMRPSQDQKH